MSGDVFGNGMLRSRHLKLVAAFDHRHVFLDPDPDPEAELPRARAALRAPSVVMGRLRPDGPLHRWRRVPAHREVGAAVGGGSPGARDRRRRRRAVRARSRRGDHARRGRVGDPARTGRPPLERRHRDVREGEHRVTCRRRRPRQRLRPDRCRPAPVHAWWRKAATSASRKRRASSSRSPAATCSRMRSTTRPASTAPTTR